MSNRPTLLVLATSAGRAVASAEPQAWTLVDPAPFQPRAPLRSALAMEALPARMEHDWPGAVPAPAGAAWLAHTVGQALLTQLPLLVVTTAELAPTVAHLVAGRDCLVLPPAEAGLGWGQAIAAGVGERASAGGWLVLPATLSQVRPGTLLAVARGLEGHAVAFAQYRGRRAYPLGFSAELYSELVALHGDEGVRRLVARYPGWAVEVDDPGVWPGAGLQGDPVGDRPVALAGGPG